MVLLGGTAWAGRDTGPDWINEQGLEIPGKAPEFVGLTDRDGNPVLCADGLPVRVPLDGIPADVPVISMDGTRYPSMAAAEDSMQERVSSGEVVVEEGDGTETVVLGPPEMFRPDPVALCDRFGSGPLG